MADPHVSPEAVTEQTTIAAADEILSIRPVIVSAGASLREVAERAVENTGCRVIAVTGGDDRLVGLIPVQYLVDDIFLKIVPEEFLGEITDVEAVREYAKHLGARIASDIMIEPVSVHPEETVRTAFERMHVSRLNGVPITEHDERVVGYVDQLELLVVWVHATNREALLEPSRRAEGDAH